MNKKPKVLILISTFYPGLNGGGPIISMLNMAKNLKKEFELFFIANHHDFGSKEPYTEVKEGWNTTEDYKVYYIPIGKKLSDNINNIIEEVNPDLLYLNSIFDFRYSIPILLNKKVRNRDIPLIICTRGELCEGAIKLKWYKKYPYIYILRKLGVFKNIFWHVTSEDEKNGVIKYIKSKDENIFNVSNIPTTFSKRNKIVKEKGELNLVFISRIQRKKNLYGAIKMLNKINDININYDIYGPLEEIEYWNKCEDLINQTPGNIIVKYRGKIEHNIVEETLQKYHMFFMPTFSENYGHAIVEAMQCGVPVLISDQTPWNKVNQFDASFAISLDEEEKFIDTIKKVGMMDEGEYVKLVKNCNYFIENEMNVNAVIQDTKLMFNSVIK